MDAVHTAFAPKAQYGSSVLHANFDKIMPVKWEDYSREFATNGALCNICVFNTSTEDWQAILGFLSSSAYEHSYFIAGESLPLPSRASDCFMENVEPIMEVRAGPVLLECYFFKKEEIEFSFRPTQIQSEAQAESIFDFMGHMAHLLSKDVIIVEDDDPERPIFRFRPNDKHIQYIPSPQR